MTRFRLTVEFDGRPFMGWQRQAHGPSVQQAIEEAVLAVTGEEARLHAAGRTDAGVHAFAMIAHVDVAKAVTPFRLMEALNALLKPQPVASEFSGVSAESRRRNAPVPRGVRVARSSAMQNSDEPVSA